MLAQAGHKPILEWLDLHPGLLSGRNQPAPAPASTPAPAPAQASAAPAPHPAADTIALAAIDTRTVLSPCMTFLPPNPADPAIRATNGAYATLEQGATQRAALAEIAGTLHQLLPIPR